MSQSSRNDQGRPQAQNEEGLLIFLYCGGKGGGGCVNPLSGQTATFSYRVPKYITANRRIVFQNNGIRLFNDAGPDGFGCSHSVGVTEYPFYMALSVDGNLTAAQIIAQGVQLSGALPYNIEFPALKIPQPSNPLWSRQIFVQVAWQVASPMNISASPLTSDMLAITKHEYDIKQ